MVFKLISKTLHLHLHFYQGPKTYTYTFIKGQKKDPKAKNSHEQRQRILWTTRTIPENKGFEVNLTRKFARKFGKIFVAKVLWGTFSVLDLNCFQITNVIKAPQG